MITHVALKTHHDSAEHIIRVGRFDSPTLLVETFQYHLRRSGTPDGVTWKVVEGGISNALVAAHEIT